MKMKWYCQEDNEKPQEQMKLRDKLESPPLT